VPLSEQPFSGGRFDLGKGKIPITTDCNWPVVPVELLELTVRFPWICCHSEIRIECL